MGGTLNVVHAAPGDLDPGFGSAGKVVLPNHDGEYSGVRLLPGGKLLVWGGASYIIARRYNVDGSPDLAYGYGGTASWYNIPANPYVPGHPKDAEVMPDGSLVVVGNYTDPDPQVNQRRPAVWRFTADGLLDTNFGTNGRLLLSGGDGDAYQLAIYNSKLYIYYGYFQDFTYYTRLTRRHANGGLDLAFGSFGAVNISNVVDLEVAGADGKIYTAQTNGTLKRYNADGSVDSSFGMFGTAPKPKYEGICPGVSGMGYTTTNINFAPGGKLLVTGLVEDVPAFDESFSTKVSVLTRYTSDGFLDNFFNGGQLVCTDPVAAGIASPKAVAQSDGKVLFASGPNAPHLQRRLLYGGADASYVYQNSGVSKEIRDPVIQSDGKSVFLYGYSNELHRRLP